jgi:hypothetical protein
MSLLRALFLGLHSSADDGIVVVVGVGNQEM